jgi:putative transposase
MKSIAQLNRKFAVQKDCHTDRKPCNLSSVIVVLRLFQPLYFFLATCRDKELVQQMEFMRAEMRMLRTRIPEKRIFLTVEKKEELLKLGEPIGSGLKHLIAIVSYGSFLRWKRKSGDEPKKMGRPRTIEMLRALIVKIASETGWGYTRVMGELKKLGIKPPSRNTVKKIMKEAGHDPAKAKEAVPSS